MLLKVLLAGGDKLDGNELEAIRLYISTVRVRVGPIGGFCLPSGLEAADDGADQSTLKGLSVTVRWGRQRMRSLIAYLDTIGLDGNETRGKVSMI